MTVTLIGPILLPGDDEPMADADVMVRLVAGSARDVGHAYANGSTASARIPGPWKTKTDSAGDFSVTVPTISDTSLYPSGAWYECTIGGGRWGKFVVKVQPTVDGTYVVTDPAIIGTDLVPPEFVQVDPSDDAAAAAVLTYFESNPIDVSDEVAAALALDPPLIVDQALAELVGNEAVARANIGAAADSDVSAQLTILANRIAALELAESTAPAVRAPGYTSVTVVEAPGGGVSFDFT